jgi:Skp family chaperone for outer membrane proteins
MISDSNRRDDVAMPPKEGHMKTTCVMGTCLVVGALAAPLFGQDASPLPVAVVNTERIFKTYQPLLDKLAPIKEAAKELEKNVQVRNVELETAINKLRSAEPGSPEAQRLQQQAGKLQGELQQYIQQERGELQKREAAIFIEFYKGLDDEVRKYAKAKGIKLVIRQQENMLDENQPLPQIINSLNRGIIFEDGLDITDDIVKALDVRNATANKP